MMAKGVVFYDIEVFQYNNLVEFYTLGEDGQPVPLPLPKGELDEDGEVKHLWNDHRDRQAIIENIIQNNVLCGYNNHAYDDLILHGMRYGWGVEAIKERNDTIIREGRRSGLDTSILSTIDCIQQIKPPPMPSLKQIQGNIGMSVEESTIPFDYDKELQVHQRRQIQKYCCHDVEACIEVYKRRKVSYFDVREHLIEMLPEDDRDCHQKTNTTTISAHILLDRAKNSKQTSIEYNLPERATRDGDLGKKIPSDIWDMWMRPVEQARYKEGVIDIPRGVQKPKTLGQCVYIFGFGGLHGAPAKPGHYTNVRLADVGSMYPSIIVATNALGDATDKYDSIRKERLAIKHTDKQRANALKLILNSVYGNLKNQYNPLYSPASAASVCIYGQVALYNLCLTLTEAGYQVINANTDGVAFTTPRGVTRDFDSIQSDWEKDFPGLVLEVDRFKEWWQRDVNNYIALTEDDHIKTKGGDCNKYAEDRPFDNNSLRIVQKALVDCIVNKGRCDERYIRKIIKENLHDHPEMYQVILKAGHTYEGTFDQTGKMYQKVNRVFPGKEGVKLYKRRFDGGNVLFPDAPDIMMVYNGDLSPGCLTWDQLDITYYHELVKKKMEAWRLE